MAATAERLEDFSIIPQTENVRPPYLANTWIVEDLPVRYRAVMSHSFRSCFPKDSCSGEVSVNFFPDSEGYKSTICLGCRAEIEVDIDSLKAELWKPSVNGSSPVSHED